MKTPIPNSSIKISTVKPDDLDPISRHYASEVKTGVATFDTNPPPLSYWESKLSSAQSGLYPFLVATRIHASGNEVGGWAALSPYDAKSAYERCAELSIYVLDNFQGQGLGRLLMNEMLKTVESHPFIHTLISRIVPTQRASIHLHLTTGFEFVGTMRQVGNKFGQVQDVSIYQYTA